MAKYRTAALAATVTAAGALTAGTLGAAGPAGSTHPIAASAAQRGQPNVVIEWNDTLLGIVRDTQLQPKTIHPTRSMAMMNAAVFDAVDAIDGRRMQYRTHLKAPREASEPAAAATAARDILAALYPPARRALNSQLNRDLTAVADSAGKRQGIDVGHAAAAAILRARSHDGSTAAAPPFTPTRIPGRFQPVPPDRKPPVFRQWGHVQPFTLTSPGEFRPPAPPRLGSAAYASSLQEVKTVGVQRSKVRTTDQTQAGAFWNAPIQDFWVQIAADAAARHRASVADTARLFTQVDLAVADSAIAFYDAKYTYDLWRPVSAIRGAGSDGNPATTPDPAWTPLAPTQADPSYPGAHSTVSAAAAAVLTSFFGNQDSFSVTSPVLPGVTRHFDSFSAAAHEAGQSRIWAGIHFPFDHAAGLHLGQLIANHVLKTVLQSTSASSY